jgi:hypothetical protein
MSLYPLGVRFDTCYTDQPEASGNAIIRPLPSNNQNLRPHIEVQHLEVGNPNSLIIRWMPKYGLDSRLDCLKVCSTATTTTHGGQNIAIR